MRDDRLSVLSENISEIREAENTLTALTEAQIYELANTAQGHSDPTALFRTVFGDNLGTPEYAAFCQRLLSGKTDSSLIAALLPEGTPFGDAYADGEVAYLPNPFSDTAFHRFEKAIPSLRALHQPSFNAACEEVYHGRAQYCILPLQNTQDGVLTSFAHLIARYELKIFRICDIPSDDEASTVRFALLRRGIVPYAPKDGFLTLGAVLPEEISIGAFLCTTDALGARLDHLHTVPLALSGLTSLSVTFRVTHECLSPLLLLLRTALDGYTAEGIYEAVDHF